jgi:hypothetical protein
LRRVVVKDDAGKRITFLTNNFTLKPELIAALYRQRWQVELFFKWIKQHLRIKAFLGHQRERREDADMDCHIDLPADRHCKETFASCHHSLYEILQILSLSMFETIPINQLLTPPSTNSERISSPISSLSSEERWDTTDRVSTLR